MEVMGAADALAFALLGTPGFGGGERTRGWDQLEGGLKWNIYCKAYQFHHGDDVNQKRNAHSDMSDWTSCYG